MYNYVWFLGAVKRYEFPSLLKHKRWQQWGGVGRNLSEWIALSAK